jgi:hypothetical protein
MKGKTPRSEENTGTTIRFLALGAWILCLLPGIYSIADKKALSTNNTTLQ